MTPRDAYSVAAVLSTAGLEIIWREACERSAATQPGTEGHEQWVTARDDVVSALRQLEWSRAVECPGLGRRSWEHRLLEPPEPAADPPAVVLPLDSVQGVSRG